MSKLVMYRNNSAYEQFLAPALAGREGFETQIFAQGTPEEEITAWIAERADWIRGMEKVFTDRTCYDAGESVPSNQPDRRNGYIWFDVETNYGGLDSYLFQPAALRVLTRVTVEETVTEVVRHLHAKEVPTKVFVMTKCMGSHDVFGRDSDEVAAGKVRACLSRIVGADVLETGDWDGYSTFSPEDTVWVFFDRHFDGYMERFGIRIPSTWRKFRLPIENLIEDATEFGIDLDVEAYSRAIREIVATW